MRSLLGSSRTLADRSAAVGRLPAQPNGHSVRASIGFVVKNRARPDEQQLIARYVDPDWERYGGRHKARLREHGVSVWALIGQLRVRNDDVDLVARDYELPREAVEAALAYYRRNRKHIDAWLLLNSEP